MLIRKIVSGGQTGADRAALDWAIAHGIPHGGWCPQGRRAEDGVIDVRYNLTETPARRYDVRTRWNVRDSDATLLLSLHSELQGGSRFTQVYARRLGRPCLHLHPGAGIGPVLADFFAAHRIEVLNVAGPRVGREPGIVAYVTAVLDAHLAFFELPRN
ncbi:MAG: putative molybdenum carrier protein [Burkholderiales bacterium]